MNVKYDVVLCVISYFGDDFELLFILVRDEYEFGDFYSMREKRRGMWIRKRRRCIVNIGIEMIDGEDEVEGYKLLFKNLCFEMSFLMVLEYEMKYKRSGLVGCLIMSDGFGFLLDFWNLLYKMNLVMKFYNWFFGLCFEDFFWKRELRGKWFWIELMELIEYVVVIVWMFILLVYEKVKVGWSKGDYWKEMYIKEDSGKWKECWKKVIDYLVLSLLSLFFLSIELFGYISFGLFLLLFREN